MAIGSFYLPGYHTAGIYHDTFRLAPQLVPRDPSYHRDVGESCHIIWTFLHTLGKVGETQDPVTQDVGHSHVHLCHDRIHYLYGHWYMVQGSQLGIFLVCFTMANSLA